MVATESERRMFKLLRFCIEHSERDSEVHMDEKGLLLSIDTEVSRSVPMSKFPFPLEQCRHYFAKLENAGLIVSSEGWNTIIYAFEVTDAGEAFLSEFSWWTRQVNALRQNVVTIILSVASALLIGWALELWGPQ